jgi:hypothetical protein
MADAALSNGTEVISIEKNSTEETELDNESNHCFFFGKLWNNYSI